MNAATLALMIEAYDKASPVFQKVRGEVERTKQTTDQFTQAGGRLTQMWQTMGGVIGAGLFMRVAGEIKSAIGGVIDFSATLQSAEIAFRVFLGGANAARDAMADLRAFTINTPFEFPQVLKAAQNLLAYGTTAADLIPTLTMLGNLSQGNAEKLGSLQLAYGQVQAATKLTGAELRQFTEAGIPLLAVLAEHFDTTSAAVKKMVEEGKVGFGDVRTVLAGLVNEGGKFHNLMGETSKSWSGALAAISDSMNLAMSDVFAPFFEQMTAAAISVAEFLQSVDFRLFAIEAGRAFQNVADWLIYFGGKVWDVVTVLYNLADIVSQNQPLLEAMAFVAAVLLAPAMWACVTAVYAFIVPLIGTGLALGALVAAVYYTLNAFGGLENGVGIIQEVFGDLVTALYDIVGPALNWLGEQFDTIAGFLTRRFITIAQGIAILGHMVGEDVSGLVNMIAAMEKGTTFEGLKAGFGKVADFVGDRIEVLKNNIQAGAEIIGSLWEEVIARLSRPIAFGGARVGMGEKDENDRPASPNVTFTGPVPDLISDDDGDGGKAKKAPKGRAAKAVEADTRAIEEALRELLRRAEQLGDAIRKSLETDLGSVLDRVKQGMADFAKAEWIASLEARINVVAAQIQKAMAEGLDPQPIIDAALPLFEAYASALQKIEDKWAGVAEQQQRVNEEMDRINEENAKNAIQAAADAVARKKKEAADSVELERQRQAQIDNIANERARRENERNRAKRQEERNLNAAAAYVKTGSGGTLDANEMYLVQAAIRKWGVTESQIMSNLGRNGVAGDLILEVDGETFARGNISGLRKGRNRARGFA